MDQFYLKHHPQSTIVYNVKHATRSEGRRSAKVAERWETTEETPLIVRLKITGGKPWIVGYQGIKEIFRSSMTIESIQNQIEEKAVHLVLRNFTGRVRNGRSYEITRHYTLIFFTAVEAETFVFTYNTFIQKMKKGEEDKEDNESETNDNDDDGDDNDDDNNNAGQSGDDEQDEYNKIDNCHVDLDLYFSEQNTQDPFPDYISD